MTNQERSDGQQVSSDRRSGIRDLAAIMFRPRRTIRSIIDDNPDWLVRTILLLAIVSAFVDDFDLRGFDEAGNLLEPQLLALVVLIGIVVATIFMVLAYYVFSAAATLAGRWMGGTGTFREVRAAIAWGLVPIVWALLYRVPAMIVAIRTGVSTGSVGPPRILVGDGRVEMSSGSLGSSAISMILALFVLDLIVIVWYFVVASNTVGEAHQFSSWKGLGTLLVAFILPFAAIGLLVFVTWVYLQRIG